MNRPKFYSIGKRSEEEDLAAREYLRDCIVWLETLRTNYYVGNKLRCTSMCFYKRVTRGINGKGCDCLLWVGESNTKYGNGCLCRNFNSISGYRDTSFTREYPVEYTKKAAQRWLEVLNKAYG